MAVSDIITAPDIVTAQSVEHENDLPRDVEKANESSDANTRVADDSPKHTSAFRSLGLLDRFLAIWIFLAMLVGILLGAFVKSTGPALQKGQFVGVSLPIGISILP
jgi:ACR3 family arsenite transporter